MVLSDGEIKAEMAKGRLGLDGVDRQIGPACYELRMGRVYYDLTESDRRVEVAQDGTILIKPGHRVILITLEQLMVPNDIIARVASKGSLFSIGLSPVSTYADPGFQGNLGIVTQNISDKYIQIPVGEPIAKVDFSQLRQPTQKPYRGQHGFHTQIWPIKHHLQKTHREVSNDNRVEGEREEAYKLLPKATADLLIRMEQRQLTVDIALFAAVIVNTLLWAASFGGYLESAVAIWTNLVATALVGSFGLVRRWWSDRK